MCETAGCVALRRRKIKKENAYYFSIQICCDYRNVLSDEESVAPLSSARDKRAVFPAPSQKSALWRAARDGGESGRPRYSLGFAEIGVRRFRSHRRPCLPTAVIAGLPSSKKRSPTVLPLHRI